MNVLKTSFPKCISFPLTLTKVGREMMIKFHEVLKLIDSLVASNTILIIDLNFGDMSGQFESYRLNDNWSVLSDK